MTGNLAGIGEPNRPTGSSAMKPVNNPSDWRAPLPWEIQFPLYPNGPTAWIEIANAGDHLLVRDLLRTTGAPDVDTDFAYWIDDPQYDPTDRLLVRLGNQLIGHVHILHRTICWSGIRVEAAILQDLVVLPEFENSDCQHQLLVAAIAQAQDDGALLVMQRARQGILSREPGWIRCWGHAVTQASVRDVLAYLTPPKKTGHRQAGLHVRLCRRIEMQELMAIYRMALVDQCGLVWRTEPYWQWLLGRKVHDQVLVVERSSKRGVTSTIGYAMIRRDRVIELIVLPGFDKASVALLLRLCRDVIERGFQTITLHLPSDHRLHEVLVTAGGCYIPGIDTPSGELYLRLIDVDRWIRFLSSVWHQRMRSANLPRPYKLVFEMESQMIGFTLSRRGARIMDAQDAAPDIRCRRDDFDRLLVGQLDLQKALNSQRLSVVSRQAETTLRALFPHTLVWQSPIDNRVGF